MRHYVIKPRNTLTLRKVAPLGLLLLGLAGCGLKGPLVLPEAPIDTPNNTPADTTKTETPS